MMDNCGYRYFLNGRFWYCERKGIEQSKEDSWKKIPKKELKEFFNITEEDLLK